MMVWDDMEHDVSFLSPQGFLYSTKKEPRMEGLTTKGPTTSYNSYTPGK